MKLNLEADDNDSHKERESEIREWQEVTKNNRPPRVKVEETVAEKEQPAPGRKTVNHVLYDMFDPRSDDEFSDDDWKPEPKYIILFPYTNVDQKLTQPIGLKSTQKIQSHGPPTTPALSLTLHVQVAPPPTKTNIPLQSPATTEEYSTITTPISSTSTLR